MLGSSSLARRDQLLEQGCPFFGPEPLERHCSDKISAVYVLQVALEYKSFNSNSEAELPESLDFANTYLYYLKEIWNLSSHFCLISV